MLLAYAEETKKKKIDAIYNGVKIDLIEFTIPQ